MPLAPLPKQFGIKRTVVSDHVDESGSEERPTGRTDGRGVDGKALRAA